MKKSETAKQSWVSWFALAIALIGGFPGFLTIKNYWERSNIHIGFDSENSVLVPIDSKDLTLRNKLALLLYRITMTGKGSEPAYIR